MADTIDITVNDITSINVATTALPIANSATTDPIFDRLMKAAMLHAQQEYSAGRIKGPDWARVYLGIMQTVLAQSIQYALAVKQAEKQVELLETQKESLTQEIKHKGFITQAQLNSEYGYAGLTIDATEQWRITALNSRSETGMKWAQEDSSVKSTRRAEEKHIKELAQFDAQRQITQSNRSKIERETLMVETQRQKMIEQVDDNKLINGAKPLADVIGMAMNGGIDVPKEVWAEFFGMIGDLVESVRSLQGKIDVSAVAAGSIGTPKVVTETTSGV